MHRKHWIVAGVVLCSMFAPLTCWGGGFDFVADGVLVAGTTCPIVFQSGGMTYEIENTGAFMVGDPVLVIGTWFPGCVTPCNVSDGCVVGNTIEPGTPPTDPNLVRGDCNDDGTSNIADVVFLLGFLFPDGSPNVLSCDDACDGNDDGGLNIADSITMLNALFGSPAVPLPAPLTCGPDGTTDSIDCAMFSSCP